MEEQKQTEVLIEEALYDDSFVGVHFLDGKFEIKFPLGFNLPSKDDENLYQLKTRKDTLLLMKVLNHYKTKDKVIRESFERFENNSDPFPIYAYMYIYNYFNKYGYYIPKEVTYKKSTSGKINWNRTIKQTKPIVSNNNVVYLETIRNKISYNENELIAIINRYCVYESFVKIGCLFTNKLPKKQTLKGSKKNYIKFLSAKIQQTFNDQELELFKNMKKILETESNDKSTEEYYFGTTHFNNIWEAMIDDVYGISKSDEDFQHPKIKWHLANDDVRTLTLKPDTIMKVANRPNAIYILDAKYYKAGNDKNASMPGGESILKQLVYAEQFKRNPKYAGKKLLNAFILPYDKEKYESGIIAHQGSTNEEWFTENYKQQHYDSDFDYIKIQAIQMDTKHLMQNHSRATQTIFDELADEIEKGIYNESNSEDFHYSINDEYRMAASTKK